jgi:hypothetical protein
MTERYVSRVSNGRGFRMVYRHGDGWWWHTNVTMRLVPPRYYANRSGWVRWKWLGITKACLAYCRLWVRRERRVEKMTRRRPR